jgi:Predicted membrane protein
MHGSANSRIYKYVLKILSRFFDEAVAIGMIQFLRFCLVGCSNVVVSLAFYYILFFLGCNAYIANTIGYFAGLINSYVWNIKWVFKKNKLSKITIIKFISVYAFTYVLGMLILYILNDLIGLSPVISPIINIIITTPINFFLIKYWSFGEKREGS